MNEFFAFDYSGEPFQLFGPAHLWTLAVLAGFFALLIGRGRRTNDHERRIIRLSIAGFLLMLDALSHLFWVLGDAWTVKYMLPFHMCTAMTYVMAYALVTDSRRLYPLVYFLGLGGALQALITPDAGVFGFPHFRYFDAVLSHAGLVLGGLWVVLVERIRPTFRNVVETILGLNAYALVIFFVNKAIGSNYLFVNGKPDTASAIDMMPEWPFYILVLEALVLVVFMVMLLPFLRRQSDRTAPPETGST